LAVSELSTLSLHDALPILDMLVGPSEIISDIFLLNFKNNSVIANTPYGYIPASVASDYMPWFDLEHIFDDHQFQLREIRLPAGRDRKSTRLNSSHVKISYA